MTMDNFNIFGMQVAFSFISFFLVSKYYIWPKVSRMPVDDALRALVTTNIFHHLWLALLVSPQAVAPPLPPSCTDPVAYGDMITVVLALIAFVGLASKKSWGRPVPWLFNILGSENLLMAFATGVPAH